MGFASQSCAEALPDATATKESVPCDCWKPSALCLGAWLCAEQIVEVTCWVFGPYLSCQQFMSTAGKGRTFMNLLLPCLNHQGKKINIPTSRKHIFAKVSISEVHVCFDSRESSRNFIRSLFRVQGIGRRRAWYGEIL